MDVKSITKKWLEDNGYDGLCNGECGCQLDYLAPCGQWIGDCEPAHTATPDEARNHPDYDDGLDFFMIEGKAYAGIK